MSLKVRTAGLALALAFLSGCQGMHRTGNLTTVHAESLHLFGLQIPGSAQDKAVAMLPKDAEIITGATAPEDTQSLFGILNRIWGIGYSTFTVKEK